MTETIQASVKRTIHRAKDFSVLAVSSVAGEQFVACGRMPEFYDGQTIELSGEWKNHDKFGQQFSVNTAAEVVMASNGSIEAFLINKVKGCGEQKAKLLSDFFGSGLREILDKEPHRLKEVPKLGKKLADKIISSWKAADAQEKSLSLFLSELGLNPHWSFKVALALGPKAVSILKSNPYRLADVYGIGFVTADEVAIKMGWDLNSPERSFAISIFLLREYCQEGHTYIVQEELVERIKAQKIDSEVALQAIASHLEKYSMVEQKSNFSSCLYLPKLFDAENRLSRSIAKILKRSESLVQENYLNALIVSCEQEMGISLTDRQKDAVQGAFKHPVSILTGRPGTGKTKCVQMVVQIAKILNWKLNLAAPTGRAAKNMSIASGADATTIHRLLECNKDNKFTRDSYNPLDCQLLVLDEMSMGDLELSDSTFDAVRPGTHVLLIGDPDQLPSVGPGKVLQDLIRCGLIPTTHLDQIHRQAAQSLIITNAHRVLDGKNPIFPSPDPNGKTVPETFLFEPPKNLTTPSGRAKWIKTTLLRFLTVSLPKRLIFDPIRDVQILIPMKVGELGVHEMNRELQNALNPIPEGVVGYEKEFNKLSFRLGDRVQVMKNLVINGETSSPTRLVNGDVGIIQDFDNDAKQIVIQFDSEVAGFPYKEVSKLSLAYAITIHRSQGSEYPITLVIMSTQHTIMLQRNLLYTAQTRPRKHLFFFGEQRAIEMAVNNSTIQNRNSLLAVRIKQLSGHN